MSSYRHVPPRARRWALALALALPSAQAQEAPMEVPTARSAGTLTAKKEKAAPARQVPADKRMAFFEEVEKRVAEGGCGPELLAWIQKQPIIQEASQVKRGNISYRFTDGLLGIVHCH